MSELLLFHHAQGQTPGFFSFAEGLRQAGHVVHTPDLYHRRTFDTLEAGIAYAKELGFDNILENGVRTADGMLHELVYAGFSLGVMPAQKLAQTRPGARGALLFHACFPPSEFGEEWPPDVPVQVHAMEADPFFVEDQEAAQLLVGSAARAELFLYPGHQHLFTDSSLPSYDAGATSLLMQRVLDFLKQR